MEIIKDFENEEIKNDVAHDTFNDSLNGQNKKNQPGFIFSNYLGVSVKIAPHDEFTDENLDTIFKKDTKKRSEGLGHNN